MILDLEEKLKSIRRKEEEEEARKKAQEFGLPYLNLSTYFIDPSVVSIVPEEEAKKGNLAVIKKEGKRIYVAVKDPLDKNTREILDKLKEQGYYYNLVVVSPKSLRKAWSKYQEIIPEASFIRQIQIDTSSIFQFQAEIKNLNGLKEKINELQSQPISYTSKMLELILTGGLQTLASDIHFEREKNRTLLRYRIDGILYDVTYLSLENYKMLLSRIKLISGLLINITDVPQDGSFSIKLKDKFIDIRTSCIPGLYGENIVLRILNPDLIDLSFSELGLEKDMLKTMEKEIRKPNGMIVNTGPTGCGKTTTLYAFIKEINKPNIKIITLEDPIEYRLEGIVQTEVNREKGYTFLKGLRSILRHDPDVMLIGEIRDKTSAEVALHSALTGHLLFTTLHTNDAAGAIPRYIELGIKPNILASALNVVMAQRLVRKLCPYCKEQITPSSSQLEKIENAIKNIDKQKLKLILKTSNPVSAVKNGKIKLYKAKGCKKCSKIGYKGRIGIFEMFVKDEEIEKLISQSPSHIQIFELTRKKGMRTMYEDGILKVLQGITTIEEVERVAGSQYPLTRRQ
ncbi:type II/IV secretion system protein [bacterium]|nr:type II/IV secretion system protein [bacterium]